MIHRKHLEFGKKISEAGLGEGLVQNFRVLGTIVAFELNSTEKNYLNQSAAGLTSAALQHNIFIRPLGNTIYLMPPYCITGRELETVYDTLIGLLQKNAR